MNIQAADYLVHFSNILTFTEPARYMRWPLPSLRRFNLLQSRAQIPRNLPRKNMRIGAKPRIRPS
jgi:hypothetical protein